MSSFIEVAYQAVRNTIDEIFSLHASKKSPHDCVERGSLIFSCLAITSVDCLSLVFLAAVGCFLDELLTSLGKSVAEIAAAAEIHFGEHFLDVGLDDHMKIGEGVEVRSLRMFPLLAQGGSSKLRGSYLRKYDDDS